MKLVAFIGKKGAGKDTAADVLIENKLLNKKVRMAGPLKTLCSEVFGVAPLLLNNPKTKDSPFKEPIVLDRRKLRAVMNKCIELVPEEDFKSGLYLYKASQASIYGLENRLIKSPRELLQVVGTDFIRNRVFKEWHLRALFNGPMFTEKNSFKAAIVDVRFENEMTYIKSLLGNSVEFYYIERPNCVQDTHESEAKVEALKALIPAENILVNGDSEEDFKELVLKKVKVPKAAFDPAQTINNFRTQNVGRFVFTKE